MMHSIIFNILSRQVYASSYYKSADHLSTINFENHKHPKDMYLGLPTKSTLSKLFEGGTISDSLKDKFLDGVQTFYERSFKYGMEKLHIDDALLKNAVFGDFSKRENDNLDNVLFFVERLDLNMKASAVNKLSEEFLV